MPPPSSPPPPSEPPRNTGVIVGLAFAGVFTYAVVNVIVGVVALNLESTVALGVAAGLLALVGIGVGLVLVLLRKSWSIGLGLGLMIGWSLTSIISAGWCTGLNPGLYS